MYISYLFPTDYHSVIPTSCYMTCIFIYCCITVLHASFYTTAVCYCEITHTGPVNKDAHDLFATLVSCTQGQKVPFCFAVFN